MLWRDVTLNLINYGKVYPITIGVLSGLVFWTNYSVFSVEDTKGGDVILKTKVIRIYEDKTRKIKKHLKRKCGEALRNGKLIVFPYRDCIWFRS